jgi:hypothetical protein
VSRRMGFDFDRRGVLFFKRLGPVPLIRAPRQWDPLKGSLSCLEQSLEVAARNRTSAYGGLPKSGALRELQNSKVITHEENFP